MDILSDCVDSPLSENPSPSTEPSVEESAPRSLEGLRTRLNFPLIELHPCSNEDTRSDGSLQSSTLKKKFKDQYTPLETTSRTRSSATKVIENLLLYIFAPGRSDLRPVIREITQEKSLKNLNLAVTYSIGQGACGVIKKVRNNNDEQIYVAKIVKSRGCGSERIEQIKREHQILSKLQHKNIIQAKELFLDEVTGDAQLILEYFSGQTLEELIIERGQLPEELVKHIVTQLLSALKHVHDKGVCHRDITALNILVNEDYEVKLIDFNISKIYRPELWSPCNKVSASQRKNSSPISHSFTNYMLTNIGTDYYKAPEVVTNVPYNNSVDMWSLGVVTFYALAGYKPFQSKNLERLYDKISKAECKWDSEAWANISYEATLFVKACLKQFSFVRLGTKEALYHPWVKGIKLTPDLSTQKERRSRSKHASPQLRTPRRENTFVSTKQRNFFPDGLELSQV